MIAPLPPADLARAGRALAASHDGFWERDLVNQALWCSPGLVDLLGPEAVQQPGGVDLGHRHVHPEDCSRFREAIDHALATRGSFDFEARLQHADGQWHWMHGRGQVWLDAAGQPRYLCGTLSDVDREKQAQLALQAQQRALEAMVRERTAGLEAALALAEQRRLEAERANAAKSRFLAHMSHEIRTPLNGVLGLTELCLATGLNPTQRRYLEAAHGSGQTLLQLISDVLDLSRIESGRVELRPQPFDPARAMAETLRAAMPTQAQHQVLMKFDWEGDRAWVHGDEGSLRQIVGNLLGNAVKFTEQGHVLLHGLVQRRPDQQVALTLTVADTGPGIPPDQWDRVFQPFVQGDDSLARGHGGAGLGLAIARRLAEAMQAELALDCPPGGGTRFTLRLALPEAPAPDDTAPPPAPAARGTVWLLYPTASAGDWLARRMARLGWRTRVLPSVDAAAALAQRPRARPPELVLVSEPMLAHVQSLRPLRQALPRAEVRLLVRPHWTNPELDAEAAALQIGTLVAPLLPELLAQLGQGLDPPRPATDDGLSRPAVPLLPAQAEVLLVEDNPVNQLVGQEFLRHLGLSVRLAPDGAAALAACVAHPPQLVLMDLQMPGMDGLTAARALRGLQREGRWPGAPIVALTAHASAADRAACRAAGMDGVMTKPMSLATLRRRLSRWLSVT